MVVPEGPSPRPSRRSRDLKRLGMSLALVALQRLADPEVRRQVAEQGRTVAESGKRWREERAVRRRDAGLPVGVGLADRFGRRKLERRVDRLRSSVLLLGEGRPELAADLDPVLAALEEVTTALDVAALLPFTRRVRAHQRVDRVLDELEVGLFEAALPPGS